ncbi:virulence RhuM family protein [Rhodospirillum centenum]|uniref:DNA-binding protein, putative n=1 Tax=Rhodospirillum centenum (strain ATCC 51521 / SW) TaxID=414684 RepID=B6IQ09_RHOCS|nr:virulence RhuM family protein [Rhodospirillum centenum]ACI97545.1 DNA-binding protein, putative [Rhodospirillum centenum SW]
MSTGEVILYTTEDGRTEIQLRSSGGTVWLTQEQMAILFDRERSVITKHIGNLFADGELGEESNVQNMHVAHSDKPVRLYSLDVVLAVGYRVRSERGVQFRRWATTVLKEYLVKGFVMNDERLKDPKFDYFDELLERIRDIRASEARFYQKVRDILALSVDYTAKADTVPTFYATIQNKMLHAVTHHTAAELIAARADENAPNMGLTSWKGGRVRKADVTTAKNYLGETEVRELNLIVGMFLDTAELRSTRRQQIHLAEWETILDGFLKANELPLLHNAGSVSAKQAEKIAHDRYALFDTQRKEAERRASEEADELDELKRIAEQAATARNPRPAPAKKGTKR